MPECQKCETDVREEDLVYKGVLNGQPKYWCTVCVAEAEENKPAEAVHKKCTICEQPNEVLTSDGVCHPCAEKAYLRPSWPLAGE